MEYKEGPSADGLDDSEGSASTSAVDQILGGQASKRKTFRQDVSQLVWSNISISCVHYSPPT
jgi:hypothetical protein